MTNDARQKIIDKIRKLMALSTSSNEHEAALAAERAQSILAEYNLSLADVTMESKTEDEFIIDKELVNDSFPWKRQLASATAKMYFCSYFFAQFRDEKSSCGRSDRHNFVGASHNIIIAKMMFVYLMETTERLAREAAAKQYERREAYRRSFMWGCSGRLVQRIFDRIEQTKKMTTKTESGTTLPALANLYDHTALALKSFLDNKVGKLHESGRGRSHDVRGHMDGREAGNKVGLDPQVGARSGHLLGHQ